ncbi:PREDICTED: potassium channel subfamily K member 4-like [Branchiostoma belcheri]|uniref:Potassium channel subfamily K member 4-like n=1 Tax=Branchiostoma belcheri TaxID=7741 RepID=A0A6P5AAU4_BRABE|nr:PREDICTED: potassium channel subfamily K member 4-like [Branchiostoma belcheri]
MAAGRTSWAALLGLFVVFCNWLFIGAKIFQILEEHEVKGIRKTDNELVEKLVKGVVGRTFESKEEVLKFVKEIDAARNVTVNYGSDTTDGSSSLDYLEALLFCLTIVTTIGYGHVPITTDAGKVFCCLYAFLGIPLTLTMLAAIGGEVAPLSRFLEDQVKKRLAFLKKHPDTIRFVNIFTLTTVNLGVFFFLPAYVFSCQETDWSYLDALYYVFITLSTVGFGDYVATLEPRPTYAQNVAYKIATFCWILTGLCFLASVFDLLVEEMKGVEERIKEGMNKPLDGGDLDNGKETEKDIQGHTKKEEQGEGMTIRARTAKKAAVSSEEMEEAGTCLPDKEKHA